MQIRKVTCKYCTFWTENDMEIYMFPQKYTEINNLLQAFNLSFTLIFSNGKKLSLPKKNMSLSKTFDSLMSTNKNMKSYMEWNNVLQFDLSMYANSIGGNYLLTLIMFFCLGNKDIGSYTFLPEKVFIKDKLEELWILPSMNIKEATSLE